MNDIEEKRNDQLTGSWWSERSSLEKVGVVALGVVGGAVVAAIAFPSAASAAVGGALTATGALLLKRGFKG
jgi:hypothetical protein